MQEPLGAIDEAREPLPGVDALLRAAFKKPGFGARTLLGGRQPDEGQIVAALEVRAFLAKLLAALDIDEPRDGIGKIRDRIALRGEPLGFHKYRPARSEAPQRTVEARGDRDHFSR